MAGPDLSGSTSDPLRSPRHIPTDTHKAGTLSRLATPSKILLAAAVMIASSLGSAALAAQPTGDTGSASQRPAAGGPSGPAKRLCNPQPPEYAGCSIAQINNWEDGDVGAAKAHYPQDRWGQAGFNWSNLGDAHNDKLRRLYTDAVAAYTEKQETHGLHGKAAQPKFATWSDFKAATDCSGGFWGAAWSTMCRFSDAMDNAVPDFTKITLVCGGWALVGGAVGRAVAAVMSTVAPEAAGAAVVGTSAYCTLVKIAGALGIPTPKAGQRRGARERAIADVVHSARLAWRAVLPFGRADLPAARWMLSWAAV
jgi:hypothetical protein